MATPASMIVFRHDTSQNWASAGPIVLLDGEPGFETDTLRLKVGDGVTEWALLPYITSPGPAGPRGSSGATGLQGSPGPIGDKGYRGSTGPQGPQGPQGYLGPFGPQGLQGPAGVTGPTGNTGPDGPIGPDGYQGSWSTVGPQGPPGDTGPQGAQGIPGITGTIGSTGATGSTDTSSFLEKIGSVEYKTAGTYTYTIPTPSGTPTALLLEIIAIGGGGSGARTDVQPEQFNPILGISQPARVVVGNGGNSGNQLYISQLATKAGSTVNVTVGAGGHFLLGPSPDGGNTIISYSKPSNSVVNVTVNGGIGGYRSMANPANGSPGHSISGLTQTPRKVYVAGGIGVKGTSTVPGAGGTTPLKYGSGGKSGTSQDYIPTQGDPGYVSINVYALRVFS